MLDPKYKVTDDSWQAYPSAVSVQQLIQAKKGIQLEPEYEADSLLAQIALSVGRDITIPSELNEKELELMIKTFEQAKDTLACFQKKLKLSFDISFKDERFWLFDSLGQKLMSGFFNNLVIDKNKRLGIVIRHYLTPKRPVPVEENKELEVLALIATDIFKLGGVVVASVWISDTDPDLFLHTYKKLQVFREELQILLKQIH